MYHENHKINDTVLTIINDGNGSQCGMDYGQRCTAAKQQEYGVFLYMRACRNYKISLSKDEVEAAARILQSYYIKHLTEMS